MSELSKIKSFDQEESLLSYLQELDKDREDRGMVQFHLSQLKSKSNLEKNIQSVVSSFEILVSSPNSEAQLFVLKNFDIYVFFKNSVYDEVKETVKEVSKLFIDDLQLPEKENTEQDFSSWFDIEKDFSLILTGVQNLVSKENIHQKRTGSRKDARSALKAKQKLGYPLTPRVLAKVETALARADLSSLVRRQIVCRVDIKMVPENLFSELFISIQNLRETILPDVNLASNRWLFQHLTTTFDKRMLAMLGKTDVIPYSGDLSFNINVSTVLSPEFKKFDEKISGGRRGSLIIELQKEDIFSNLDAYVSARDFAQAKGYKVCIDGLTLETFSIIDRERLGADLTKLVWNPSLTDSGEELREKTRSIIKLGGGERTILCRCDNMEAIEMGHSLGIELFQGRHVETLIIENERRLELEKIKKVNENEEENDDKKDTSTRGKEAAGKPGKK
jgi:hypothetical protein